LASGQDWLSKFKRKHADLYEAAADANSKAAAAKHTPTASATAAHPRNPKLGDVFVAKDCRNPTLPAGYARARVAPPSGTRLFANERTNLASRPNKIGF